MCIVLYKRIVFETQLLFFLFFFFGRVYVQVVDFKTTT